MVYPALTCLEEIGYAAVEADGSRKRYHISASGHTQLGKNRSVVDSMVAQFEHVGEKMERMRRAFSGRDAGTGEDLSSGPHGATEVLSARRH